MKGRLRDLDKAGRYEWKGYLHRLQDGRCAYCAVRRPMRALTFDHVMPLRAGGLDVFHNLLLACEPCNGEKADHLPVLEFHESIRAKIHRGRRAA